MNSPTLEFWFEFASTYSYIASSRIEQLCEADGVRLIWKPFLLGPIFALQGWNTSPFVVNPRRGAYMWRDMERLTEKYGLAWNKPSVFPRNAVLAARVAAAYAEQPWIGRFIAQTFAANFHDDRDLNDEGVVLELLSLVAPEPQALLQRALEPPLRDRVRENTERAIELGIMGAPNCVVDGELFWGEETLEDAIAWSLRGR